MGQYFTRQILPTRNIDCQKVLLVHIGALASGQRGPCIYWRVATLWKSIWIHWYQHQFEKAIINVIAYSLLLYINKYCGL